MQVDDRSAVVPVVPVDVADVWEDWGEWQDWEDERTSPLEELPQPYRDDRSLIQRLAASPDIQIVWRSARAPGAAARSGLPR